MAARSASTAVRAAVRGYAAYVFEPHLFAAPSVAIRFTAVNKSGDGAHTGTDAPPTRLNKVPLFIDKVDSLQNWRKYGVL